MISLRRISVLAGRNLDPTGLLQLGSRPWLGVETPRSGDAEGSPQMGPFGGGRDEKSEQYEETRFVHFGCVL